MLPCEQVWKMIAGLPNLSQVWDQRYVLEDCREGFKQPWLNRLVDDPDEEIRTELKKLDGYLGMIRHYLGFKKLRRGLRARNIEEFESTLAEVKTDAWIASYNTLQEIRPPLPRSNGESDFKLSLVGEAVYGEVWEARDLPSSWISNSPIPIAITDQRTEQPKRIRTLHQKGNSQLPSNVIGIWVAHVYHATLSRSWINYFAEDMSNRPNVLGVVLWVRSGSPRFSSPCVRCRDLTNEGHDIYWLDNKDCEHIYLQRKFLCSVIN